MLFCVFFQPEWADWGQGMSTLSTMSDTNPADCSVAALLLQPKAALSRLAVHLFIVASHLH